MNKRIRELAEQAELKYHNWITGESTVIDGDFKYPRVEDFEKFAELIVRECAFVAQNKDDTNINLRYGRAVAAGKIIEHFGVEE